MYFQATTVLTAVYRWVPDSTPTAVAHVGTASDGSTLRQLADVAFTDSLLVVIGIFDYPDGANQTRVAWIDLPAGGTQHDVYAFVAARRLAAVPGHPLVVLEAANGNDSNLWLLGFP